VTDAGSTLATFSRDCPVTLYAYRSRERRDAGLRSGEPDWKPARACGPATRQVGLRRGEETSFETEAQVGEILGAARPPGRYYFAVAVQTGGPRFLLAAGEAYLR
jgi:hypothetical protein